MSDFKLFDTIKRDEFIYTIVEILDEDNYYVEIYNSLTEEYNMKTMTKETFSNLYKT